MSSLFNADFGVSDSKYSAMSTWMYQYWFFAFKTAKFWGWGPQNWTADLLGFDEYPQQTKISISLPNTSGASEDSPASQSTTREDEMSDAVPVCVAKMPSALCRWSVHYPGMSYNFQPARLPDPLPDPLPDLPSGHFLDLSPTENINPKDKKSWPMWHDSRDSTNFIAKLSNSLESNDFSNVRLDEMPIAVDHVAEAARASSNELFKEALGFSIISRNESLVEDLVDENEGRLDLAGLYPFHLAISYLDGSKTCCNILRTLISAISHSLSKLYVNEFGHTILDQLMIAILKAHTSCLPSVVDVAFKEKKRFEGEDVDICGRWDADSDCIRTLSANGTSSIPIEWKHMFCHTSIQTICHCIGSVFGVHRGGGGPDINSRSGLFARRCLCCGLELQLLPLHTLILVGFYLSRSGCRNENSFGILACLLCLMSNGANPLLKAHVSVQALLGDEEGDECSHKDLDPAELLEMVPVSLQSTWSRENSSCWQVIRSVLRRSQAEWRVGTYDHYLHTLVRSSGGALHFPDCRRDVEYHGCFFGGNRILASLWAAVQAELLTYRRLNEEDEWISPYFDMHTLSQGLTTKGKADIALLQKEMIKPFCSCGRFPEATPACPTVFEVAEYMLLDLGGWDRMTLIRMPR